MLNGNKAPLQSKTIWGGIIAAGPSILALIAALLGITPADSASIVGYLTTISAAVGGLWAIYGRYSATHKVGPDHDY